jgi:hypothetical protein
MLNQLSTLGAAQLVKATSGARIITAVKLLCDTSSTSGAVVTASQCHIANSNLSKHSA